jgi:hypothetical protein
MSQLLRAVPDKEEDCALRASAYLTFRWWPKTRTPFGSSPRSRTAMGAGSAWSRSLPRRPCATARACPLYPSVLWVLVRDPQRRFKTQALLCSDLEADPQKILSWFVMRWQLEATFQEVRRQLGFETQRQWSELAIRRTTPALLGLFSLVTILAHERMTQAAGAFRREVWYH